MPADPLPQTPLFCLRNISINLRLLSLIHILSSHLHPRHRGSELVTYPAPPPLPLFIYASIPGWSWHFSYTYDSF